MGILSFLALIALTTAFAAMYELFIPAMQDLEIENPNDPMLSNRWLTYVVMFLLAILFFVPLLPIVVTPGLSTRFRNGIVRGLVGAKN